MAKTESVLISVSVVVTAPESGALPDGEVLDVVLEDFCDAVAGRLRAGVAALKQEPWFEQDAGVNFNYLSEENAGRCARCGRWTSDYDAPDFLDLLMIGKTIEGELLCDECIPDGLYEVGRRYARPVGNDAEETQLDLTCALQVMQRIILRTRHLANNGIAARDLDAVFDYTDDLYNVAIREKSLDGSFRSVLEDAAKRYPAVFGGLMAVKTVAPAERFECQESRAHQDGYSGSLADEVIRQRGE